MMRAQSTEHRAQSTEGYNRVALVRQVPSGKSINGLLAFYKLFFVISICILHISPRNPLWFGIQPFMNGAYIYVDFFFILSGFFLARHTYNKSVDGGLKDTALYIAHKLRRTYPFIFLSVVAMIPFSIMGKYTHSKIAYIMAFSVMQGFTEGVEIINFYLWYYSVMLFTDFIFHRLLSSRRAGTEAVSVVAAFVGYMYFFNKKQMLPFTTHAWIGGLHLGLLRGLAGTALGVCLWRVHTDCLAELGDSKRGRLAACVLSLLSVCLVVIETICKARTLYDFVCIPLFCIAIEGAWIAGQGISINKDINKGIDRGIRRGANIRNAIPRLMDMLTFPMYCMQFVVAMYGGLLGVGNGWWYLPTNMTLCLLLVLLLRGITKAAYSIRGCIKHE